MVRTGVCLLAAGSLCLAFTLLGCPDDASDDDTVSTDDDVTGDDDSGGDDDTTGDDDTSGDDDTFGDDDTTGQPPGGDDDTTGDDDTDLCTAEAPMYVHAHDVLLTFDPAPPYDATPIAPFSDDGITDLAVDDMGCMYAIGLDEFYWVDATTAHVIQISTLPEFCNSLAALASGELAVGCGENIYLLDPLTGAATLLGSIPGWAFEGDLFEMPGGELLLLAFDVDQITWLLSFDPTSGLVTPLGSTDHHDVYGLGSYGGVLYAFANAGFVLQLDPATGAATPLANHTWQYTGTATR